MSITQQVLNWSEWPEVVEILRQQGNSDEKIGQVRAGLLQLADLGWFAIESPSVARDVAALANILWHKGLRWLSARDEIEVATWISVGPDPLVAGFWRVHLWGANRPEQFGARVEAWEFGS